MTETVNQFKESLGQLTFNSRPIIDSLTALAAENSEAADEILDAITSRLYRCVPEQKLFVLYLLDSICKQVGNPYNILIGDEIFKLFSHVYMLVDDGVRQKMRNLFETWKLTKSKGTNLPLFPREELDKVGGFLAKALGLGNELSNTKLIQDIDELLPIFQTKLNSNSDNHKLQDKFNALLQLKELLQSQKMQISELNIVQSQLNSIKHQELNNLHSDRSSSGSPNTTPTIKHSLPASLPPVPTVAVSNTSPQKPEPTNSLPSLPSLPAVPPTLPSLPAIPKLPQPSALPSITKEVPISRSNEVFDQLINFGLITYELDFNKPRVYHINYPKKVTEDQPANFFGQFLGNRHQSEYEAQKYAELKKLQVDDVQSFISKAVVPIQCKQLLYEAKYLKCSVCGKRFTSDNVGHNSKRLHLDWHFRMNKKLKTSNIVQSRNWYMKSDEWIEFKEKSLLELQNENNPATQAAAAAVEAAEEELNKEVPYVVIPSTETNTNNKCLICREQVKGTFNEELGEWCWVNCIIQPGEPESGRKIVHVNCYNETRKRNAQDDLNTNVKREKV